MQRSALSNYPEERDGPTVLVDRLYGGRAHLEARLLDESLVIVYGIAVEVHWRAEPIGFDLAPVGSRLSGSPPAGRRAHPPAHFAQEPWSSP